MMKNEGGTSGPFRTVIILACCVALWAFEAKAAPVVPEAASTLAYPRSVDQKSSLMTIRRCGVEDSDESRTAGRSKRYVFAAMKWTSFNLTYGIAKYSKHLDPAEVDEVMKKAFAIWAEYVDFNFTVTSSEQAVIKISFFTGEHGDAYPFVSGTDKRNDLAHAFFPELNDIAGDIHFDEDDPWTTDDSNVPYSLLQIAVHEIGHALGLHHSKVEGAIMNEWYNYNMTVVKLSDDDITGIQDLYGKNKED